MPCLNYRRAEKEREKATRARRKMGAKNVEGGKREGRKGERRTGSRKAEVTEVKRSAQEEKQWTKN